MSALPQPEPLSPRAQLRAAVAELADVLLDPASTRVLLYDRAIYLHHMHQDQGESDALLALLARNLLRDLQRGMPDCGYYARHLAQAAERL